MSLAYVSRTVFSIKGVCLVATSTTASSAIIPPCCGTQQTSSHACMRCDVRGALRYIYAISLYCSQLLSTIFHYRGFLRESLSTITADLVH